MPSETAGACASRVEGVSHRYPGGGAALEEVDLDLPRGEVTAVLGANGAGKTTLLRILAGLLAPTRGRVEVLGVAQPAAAGPRRTRELRRRVGYVRQEPALDPEMTGAETLALLAALHGVARKDRRRRVAALAEAFGTAEHLTRPVRAFSGGLKRRLHLAAGMIHDPELLLLDEPTAGLDVDGCAYLWAELERRAGAGRAVAVVTHDLAAVERHAGRAAVLEEGRLVAAGSVAALVAEHGRRRLVATLAPPGVEGEGLRRALAGTPGIGALAASGARLTVEVPGGRAAESRVLAVLATLEVEVLDVRLEPPSLLQAFRRLTRREPPAPPGGAARGGTPGGGATRGAASAGGAAREAG